MIIKILSFILTLVFYSNFIAFCYTKDSFYGILAIILINIGVNMKLNLMFKGK